MSNVSVSYQFSSLTYRAVQAIAKRAKTEKYIDVRCNSKREVLIAAIRDAIAKGFTFPELDAIRETTLIPTAEEKDQAIAAQKAALSQHVRCEKQVAVESGQAIASCELILKDVAATNAHMHTAEYKSIEELTVIDAAIAEDTHGDTSVAVDAIAQEIVLQICSMAITQAHTRNERAYRSANNMVAFPVKRHRGVRKAGKALAEIKKLYNDRNACIDRLFAGMV